MSPRRSSRARTIQPPPPASLTHTNSSISVTTLAKNDRSTRSNNRPPSPKGSSIPRSASIGDNESARVESLPPRRRLRGDEHERDGDAKQLHEDEAIDGVEEEVTRCICGQAEYPGPPASIRDPKLPSDGTTDELGNFFVQCDRCQVWQHGGCMGFTDEDQLPDKYYCEICKPALHLIVKAPNGMKSSRYTPTQQLSSSRSSSLSSAAEQPATKDNRVRQESTSIKRRATLNSRGAYDEDEMIRRAIEESKEIGTLGKRSRDASEETKQNAKRLRTSSSSQSNSPRGRSSSPTMQEPSNGKLSATGKSAQKMRGAAARNHRDKELRDQQKETAAAQRAEAANKRAARTERRRVEESPGPTPSLSPSKAAANNVTKTDPSPSHKPQANNLRKGGRPAARRGRVGRNQYTRDHPAHGDASDTPLRDTSHDPHTNGSPGHHGINGESGRSSKAKSHPARTSLNEMKRRVAAILEFVGRMQVERPPVVSRDGSSTKGTSTPNGMSGSHSASSSTTNLPTENLVKAVEAGLKTAREHINGDTVTDSREKAFHNMESGEMMETLTKELVAWQSVYGRYGEK